jgi:Asp-tRNA(Asn)/Glu-tRNA(Gln) amidotransferase A subunit family amidase
MAKKTRKVLKQESQQRAYQQAVANVNAVDVVVAPTAAATPTPAAAHSSKFETEGLQEFTYVKSDVRRSLALAGFFTVAMIVLSFIVH